jgi:hypothetical protein
VRKAGDHKGRPYNTMARSLQIGWSERRPFPDRNRLLPISIKEAFSVQDDNLGPHSHAVIKVDHIFVGHAETS